MEFIVIFKELWRRRILVGAALLVSLGIGGLLAYHVTPALPPHLKSREYVVGKASARLLVDTPNSIVADLNPAGASSLSVHAQLLADLIASNPIRDAIAQNAGIPVNSLAVVPPTIGAPVATQLSQVVGPASAPSTLTITVDQSLPLVSIAVTAPTRDLAAKLAASAITTVRSYLMSIASAQNIPTSHQPVITSLGTASSTATEGPSRMLAAAAALVVFGLSCYIILIVSGVRRRIRAARAAAEHDDDAAFGPAPRHEFDEPAYDPREHAPAYGPAIGAPVTAATAAGDGFAAAGLVEASDGGTTVTERTVIASANDTAPGVIDGEESVPSTAGGARSTNGQNGGRSADELAGTAARRKALLSWR